MTTARPWMIALAVSAAVNVFLVGGLAGMAYMRLTTPTPAPTPIGSAAIPARPAAVTAPPSPAIQPSAAAPAPIGETPRPARRASPHVAPAKDPQPVEVVPSAPVAVLAAPARAPLISAGDGLSPETRRAFRKTLNEANKRNKPLTQQARAERQAALTALTASGYDPAEVARRLASARSLELQARGNVEAALAAFTATLSPQERALLADGLSRVYAPAVRPIAGPN